MGLNQEKEISEVFEQLGLNNLDQSVYLTLLGFNQTPITPLVKVLHRPLTSIQSALQRLSTKGFVLITKRGSRQIYEAADPSAVKEYLIKQLWEVEQILPELSRLNLKKSSGAKIQIFSGDGIREIFFKALDTKSKLIHEIVAGAPLQSVLGEKFHFTRRRLKNGIKLKSLRVESRELKRYSKESHSRESREAKFLPREMTFPCSVMFWDNFVAIIPPKTEGVACLIESPSIKQMFQQIFDMTWLISRPMVTK
jgi:sugar-specific transcriptional regulator TrmB